MLMLVLILCWYWCKYWYSFIDTDTVSNAVSHGRWQPLPHNRHRQVFTADAGAYANVNVDAGAGAGAYAGTGTDADAGSNYVHVSSPMVVDNPFNWQPCNVFLSNTYNANTDADAITTPAPSFALALAETHLVTLMIMDIWYTANASIEVNRGPSGRRWNIKCGNSDEEWYDLIVQM